MMFQLGLRLGDGVGAVCHYYGRDTARVSFFGAVGFYRR